MTTIHTTAVHFGTKVYRKVYQKLDSRQPLWPTAAGPPVQPASSAYGVGPGQGDSGSHASARGGGGSLRGVSAPGVSEPPPGDAMAPFLRSPFLKKEKGVRSGVGRRRGSGGASGGEGDQERRGVGRST